MIAFVSRSAKRIVCVGVLFAAAAGIAYAAIPDSTGVYTGCMLNKVGTVRLIDPSLPASNLMSHCTNVETKFTFNQQGQQGAPGLPGAPGKDGAPGADGKDGKAKDGKDGQPFSGTFTSPNGQFSITVDDTGIKLAGPSNSIELKPDGTIENRTDSSFNVTSGGATNLVAGTSLDLTVRRGDESRGRQLAQCDVRLDDDARCRRLARRADEQRSHPSRRYEPQCQHRRGRECRGDVA